MQIRRSWESGYQSELEDVCRRKVAIRSFIEAGLSTKARADYFAKETEAQPHSSLQTVYDLAAKRRVGLRFNCKNLTSKCTSLRFTCNRHQEEIFMSELNGTVAVVTGAGRGIGREIALHQAQGGAKVGVLARTAREIDETASVINREGGIAIAIPVDLVDRLAVEDALGRIAADLGAIDLLVNNHGSFRAFGPIWECDPDVWWQDVEINL